MSGFDDVRGDDAIAYYAASIGFTRKLDISPVSAQLPDDGGPLEPGRYVIQLLKPSSSSVIAFVQLGPFIKGAPLIAVADAPSFPMQLGHLIAIEFNALLNVNNRVAGITDQGTATLYITRISRDA